MTALTEPTARTLDVTGAVLTYDVRTSDSPEPVLLLIGSPMGASGFDTLARHFADRTVVTYDPRGVERSARADPAGPSTPEEHADDLHRIIAELDSGPVDLFASSGGAVNALALVAKHPEQVRMLVAHEPPLASILPDREVAMGVTQAIHDAYQQSGFGAGMARFIVAVGHRGPMDADFASQPAPDPALFGLPTEETWPGISRVPKYNSLPRTRPRDVAEMVTCSQDEPLIILLRILLVMNPDHRLSANVARRVAADISRYANLDEAVDYNE